LHVAGEREYEQDDERNKEENQLFIDTLDAPAEFKASIRTITKEWNTHGESRDIQAALGFAFHSITRF
jgi:hypothetical protein